MFKDFDPSTRAYIKGGNQGCGKFIDFKQNMKNINQTHPKHLEEKKLDLKEQSFVGLHYCISTIV